MFGIVKRRSADTDYRNFSGHKIRHTDGSFINSVRWPILQSMTKYTNTCYRTHSKSKPNTGIQYTSLVQTTVHQILVPCIPVWSRQQYTKY